MPFKRRRRPKRGRKIYGKKRRFHKRSPAMKLGGDSMSQKQQWIRSFARKKPYGTTYVERQIAPSKLRCKCHYWDHALIPGSTIANYSELLFDITSVWDPNITYSGGTSARGLNTWKALFNDYQVYAVDIDIQFVPSTSAPATDYGVNMVCGYMIVPQLADSLFGSVNDMIEYPKDKTSKWSYLTRGTGFTSTAVTPAFTDQKNSGHFHRFITINELRKIYGDVDIGGRTFIYPRDYISPTNDRPDRYFTLVCALGSLPQAGSPTILPIPVTYVTVDITYYVEFSGIKSYAPEYLGISYTGPTGAGYYSYTGSDGAGHYVNATGFGQN